nr:ATP synthase F0 subunit 8 [Agapanthia amurensis]
MPQMAPLSWLTLFIYIIMIFLMFNISNFYNFNYIVKKNKMSKIYLKFNWKW